MDRKDTGEVEEEEAVAGVELLEHRRLGCLLGFDLSAAVQDSNGSFRLPRCSRALATAAILPNLYTESVHLAVNVANI